MTGNLQPTERAVVALILGFLVFHLILAATLGLGVDECYDISVSHDLNLSYFDHPPMHYWIVHAFLPLLGDGRAARLPFIAIFVGTTWALYLLTRHLFGARAGFWAVVALNLSLFFTLAGGWVLPDGPLMLSLAAAAYTIARGLFPASENPSPLPSPWQTWLVAGIWIGLAALSKYHALLFAVGLFIYLVTVPARRYILRHPAPWIGAAIALLIASPVFIWNAEHHWISIAFQGNRASASGFPKLGQFFANLGGQFIWLAPWVCVPLVIASYRALRQGRAVDRSWYCLCLAMPAIAIFTIVPLWGDRGLPHWQMPGWLMLFPVLGDHIAREAAWRSRPRTWAITSAVALAAVAFLVVGHAATGYGRILFPRIFAHGDPTLESYEWSPLRTELKRRGLLDRKGLFIITESWIDVGKIDQALDDALPILVFGESKQYAFRYERETFLGRDALIVGRWDRTQDIEARLAGYFSSIEELPPFEFGRSGMAEIKIRILYGHRLLKEPPVEYHHRAEVPTR
jgi:hypothetical protein